MEVNASTSSTVTESTLGENLHEQDSHTFSVKNNKNKSVSAPVIDTKEDAEDLEIQSVQPTKKKNGSDNIHQSQLAITEQQERTYSGDLSKVVQLWLDSWYDKKQWYYITNRSFWDRVYRGVFWLSQNPYVPDQASFIKENDETIELSRVVIVSPRLLDFVVYFLQLVIRSDYLSMDTPCIRDATKDLVSSMLSKPENLKSIETLLKSVYQVYNEAVENDVPGLEFIQSINAKNTLVTLLTLFETTNHVEDLNTWNNIFIAFKNDLKLPEDHASVANLIQAFNNCKNNVLNVVNETFAEGPTLSTEINAEDVEIDTDENTGFASWVKKQDLDNNNNHPSTTNNNKKTKQVEELTEAVENLIKTIIQENKQLKGPVAMLRNLLESFHGGFDPLNIQIIRTVVKKVLYKEKNEIVFNHDLYKSLVDSYVEAYDVNGPVVVDDVEFEGDGFIFTLKHVQAFLKNIFPRQIDLYTSDKNKKIFVFSLMNSESKLMIEELKYYKTTGFPLYNDKARASVDLSNVNCRVVLSCETDNAKVEACSCEINDFDLSLYNSNRNSLINMVTSLNLKRVLKQKIKEAVTQALTNIFTNIFL